MKNIFEHINDKGKKISIKGTIKAFQALHFKCEQMPFVCCTIPNRIFLILHVFSYCERGNSKSVFENMLFINAWLLLWSATWTDQINRQYSEDFFSVAHPLYVDCPPETKWTAIKEDEWGIWISHQGSSHYMSHFIRNSHQHGRDIQGCFNTVVSQEVLLHESINKGK